MIIVLPRPGLQAAPAEVAKRRRGDDIGHPGDSLTNLLCRRSHAANPVMAQFWGAPAMALMTVGTGTLVLATVCSGPLPLPLTGCCGPAGQPWAW